MTIAIDAGLLAAVLLPMPHSPAARTKMRFWAAADEALVAPYLLEYEVTSIFRKHVAQGLLSTNEAVTALEKVLSTDLRLVAPSVYLDGRSLEWAERLGQLVAYDAAYLAVAESEGADLWTADKRLSGAARRLGVDWVHLVGE